MTFVTLKTRVCGVNIEWFLFGLYKTLQDPQIPALYGLQSWDYHAARRVAAKLLVKSCSKSWNDYFTLRKTKVLITRYIKTYRDLLLFSSPTSPTMLLLPLSLILLPIPRSWCSSKQARHTPGCSLYLEHSSSKYLPGQFSHFPQVFV